MTTYELFEEQKGDNVIVKMMIESQIEFSLPSEIFKRQKYSITEYIEHINKKEKKCDICGDSRIVVEHHFFTKEERKDLERAGLTKIYEKVDLCPTCHHIWHAHRHFENFPKLATGEVIADPFIINKVGELAFKKGLKSITIKIARKPYFYELIHDGWQIKNL